MRCVLTTIHQIKSWVITYTDKPCDLVYDQKIALDRFGCPNAVEMKLKIQERVCVLDRPGYDPVEHGDSCYMCGRSVFDDAKHE